MFGTLAICLPSLHKGGSLVFTHRGQRVSFETAENSEFGQSHILWSVLLCVTNSETTDYDGRYCDVTHEIKPVTSGYRFVIIYNLMQQTPNYSISAEAIHEEKVGLRCILMDWRLAYESQKPVLKKLAYILNHRYSAANLQLKNLKGRDGKLGAYLANIAAQEGFFLLFAEMTLTIEGTDGYEDEDQEYLSLNHLVYANGTFCLTGAEISRDEIT